LYLLWGASVIVARLSGFPPAIHMFSSGAPTM
jgi:hypothetical protein